MAAANPTTAPPRLRCRAIVSKRAGDYGFFPFPCGQVVGVHGFLSTAGVRVGYCDREGHEASVRRQFAERVESPGVAEHEGHETPDPDCAICRKAVESFVKWGVAL